MVPQVRAPLFFVLDRLGAGLVHPAPAPTELNDDEYGRPMATVFIVTDTYFFAGRRRRFV